MTEDERKREERNLVLGALRGYKRRRASYVRAHSKPDSLAKWTTRGSSYEDNYRRNPDKGGHEFSYRQGLVRRLMAKVWYLNHLKSVPDLDPFAGFRKSFGEVLTDAFKQEFGEPVRVRKALTNSDIYFESESFKLELPLYEGRMRRQRDQLSRSGRRR
jgi:hypothetical protein